MIPERKSLKASLKSFFCQRIPNDEKNIILEIRAGTGGDEAALFVADLLRSYLKICRTEQMENGNIEPEHDRDRRL